MMKPLFVAGAFAAATLAHAQDRVLDDFERPAAWTVSATDDVKAALRAVDGRSVDYGIAREFGARSAERLVGKQSNSRCRSPRSQ
jgi:hypothetical protein